MILYPNGGVLRFSIVWNTELTKIYLTLVASLLLELPIKARILESHNADIRKHQHFFVKAKLQSLLSTTFEVYRGTFAQAPS